MYLNADYETVVKQTNIEYKYPEIHFGAVVLDQIVFTNPYIQPFAETVSRCEYPTRSDERSTTKCFLKSENN